MNTSIANGDVLARVVPVVAGALVVGGAAVAALPARVRARGALRRRWCAGAVAAPLFLGAMCLGPFGGALLAVPLGLVAVAEYARAVRLGRGERAVLSTAAVLVPLLAILSYATPRVFDPRFTALLLLAGALPALLSGDAVRGGERAARTVFGLLWIPVGLTGLVLLDDTVVAVGVAVAFGDLGGRAGGAALARMGGGLARPLSRLAPDRTWAGALGAGVGVAVGLDVAGAFTVTLWAAVLGGCVLGGLLRSMIAREADAGPPVFGSLLDHIGSLLAALPLAMVVTL